MQNAQLRTSRRMASLVVLGLGLLALVAPLRRARAGEAELEKGYKEKLAKPFMKKIHWEQHFKDALAKAKKEHKPVLGYFTRSYSP